MPQVASNGMILEYESFGDPNAETVLLINGLGAQMTRYPLDFCGLLVAQGLRPVRFDNRDVGLSSRCKPGDSYALTDMAADAIGLLDALGLSRAHLVGTSMGGMIAQIMAATSPQRVLSLTSIMSTSGNPDLPRPTAEALAITRRAPLGPEAGEAFIEQGVAHARVIESPGFPWEESLLRQRVRDEAARAYTPDGVGRQRAAVVGAGDRRAQLKTITAPTVVLHGQVDPLARVECGRDTAHSIPGAELIVVPGMGHNLPPQLHETFVAAILRAVARSRS